MKKSRISKIIGSRFAGLVYPICALFYMMHRFANADLIMMNGNGAPSIIENDEIEPDVILMPGMSGMIMNDDLVL